MTEKKLRPQDAAGHVGAAESRVWLGRTANAQTQRELKEEVVLECAASWFLRHGFHGASLGDIANELGLTKAALYYYAKNKEELLYKLHVRSLHAAKRARDEAEAAGGSGLDRLVRLIHKVVLTMTGSPVETFVLLEPGTLGPEHAAEIAQARQWLSRDLRALVDEGIKDGSIRPCDPKLTAFIIVGAQNWVGRWYSADGEWSRDHIAQEYAETMRRMLAAEPAPGKRADAKKQN
jgi:TetR/AcrR family transcriptional regulator